MEPNDSLSKWCRLCLNEFMTGLFLFGEEAKRLFLIAKIRKYLAFTISLEDNLSKMICEDCCKKLDGFHKFATIALNNQEKMNKLVSTAPTNSFREQKPIKDKSLLHTYLTKGIKEKITNPESEVTEMEVRVDPMIILECCPLENGECEDHESNHNNFTSDSEYSNQSEPSTTDQSYLCSACPRSFNSEILLQTHSLDHMIKDDTSLKDEEVENDEFKSERCMCPICGKSISTKGNLKVHLATHRPKGKYECDICGRIFKTQCNLHRHKEYHGGVQYPCIVCGRVYPTNSTLRAHSITHSDLRPHKCPLCDKTFKRNQDLKFHINQHTGARPYQCPYCPKAFASSGNCFSHRKRMHPLEVERDRERAAKIIR